MIKELILKYKSKNIEATFSTYQGEFFVEDAVDLDTLENLTEAELDDLTSDQARLSLAWYGLH